MVHNRHDPVWEAGDPGMATVHCDNLSALTPDCPPIQVPNEDAVKERTDPDWEAFKQRGTEVVLYTDEYGAVSAFR